MDIKQILTADVLDIIFEGRNKSYGAYELRKTYNKRLLIALCASAMFVSLLYGGFLLAKNVSSSQSAVYIDDVVLDKIPEKKIEEEVYVEPRKKEVQPVKTVQLSTPMIVHHEVPENEMPPEQTEIADAKIGLENIAGVASDDIVAPPLDGTDKGIVTAPKKQDEDPNHVFIKVEIESEYPGGMSSWIRFLKKNLSNYPEEALEKGVQGTVIVRFIVDKEGNVSNAEVVSGPEELKSAALTVIKKSGKWIPAQQNGSKVNSYKSQPITFQLSEQ